MTADSGQAPHPDRMTVRAGSRPEIEFGHDDLDAEAELVVLRTADHKLWDGPLMRPRQDLAGRADTLAIVIHDSLGNFMGDVPRRLAPRHDPRRRPGRGSGADGSRGGFSCGARLVA